jgi:hypothetical protein
MNSIEVHLAYAAVIIFLFIFRNPDRQYIYTISVFILGLFVSQVAFDLEARLTSQIIWAVSALMLFTFYLLRFQHKTLRGVIEYLKGVAILLLVIYPLPFYTLVYVGEGYFWTVLRMLTFVILAFIYSYDRWILKPDKMKKKYLVVLVGQTLLILLMLMYAFVQKSDADRQRDAANSLSKRAEEVERKTMQMLKECEELRQKHAVRRFVRR